MFEYYNLKHLIIRINELNNKDNNTTYEKIKALRKEINLFVTFVNTQEPDKVDTRVGKELVISKNGDYIFTSSGYINNEGRIILYHNGKKYYYEDTNKTTILIAKHNLQLLYEDDNVIILNYWMSSPGDFFNTIKFVKETLEFDEVSSLVPFDEDKNVTIFY